MRRITRVEAVSGRGWVRRAVVAYDGATSVRCTLNGPQLQPGARRHMRGGKLQLTISNMVAASKPLTAESGRLAMSLTFAWAEA